MEKLTKQGVRNLNAIAPLRRAVVRSCPPCIPGKAKVEPSAISGLGIAVDYLVSRCVFCGRVVSSEDVDW